MTTKTINLGYIARVEGEGALYLKVDDGEVLDLQLKIFEPPRFFEALLRGRGFEEAPDITARICGICPVAYQMSAVHAMERITKTVVPAPLRELRRLLYCGEWIESHALHVFMLHAPDFLGFPNAVEMAKAHPEVVKQGLFIKKIGNAIMSLLGGREIHPINVRLGGFYKMPPRADFERLLFDLEQAWDESGKVVEWVSSFVFPHFERDYEFVALRGPGQYPMCEGRIVSSKGLDVAQEEFESVVEERQVPYSNALQARIRGRGAYLCGPLARFALNYDLLPIECQEWAEQAGIAGGTRNPYKSIIVRAIEIHFALGEAIRILRDAVMPPAPFVDVNATAGSACAATEAPRGLLFHRYDVDATGHITAARMIPPTSQNQLSIEEDLRLAITGHAWEIDVRLQALCEQAIRNHDPCISCATHFLKIRRVDSEDWNTDQGARK